MMTICLSLKKKERQTVVMNVFRSLEKEKAQKTFKYPEFERFFVPKML
ncbi:MAG: hypothetical protein CM15mV19_0920 [uncultured marine virus]|nr:MAG: hypothetical protein CM15mV19_0920 [uncultured marine virus]